MKQSQRIAKNVLAGGVGVGLGGLIQLLAVVFIARSVSVPEFGTYSFILAFAMFFWLLADAGLSNILVREISTRPEKMSEILGAALALIWILSIAGELLILAIVPFLHFSLYEKGLTALMGIATLTQFHCAGYGAALRSKEDNELQALGFVLHKVFFLGFIYFGFVLGLGLLGIVLGHLIPNLLLWFFYRRIVVRRYGAPHMQWNPARWKQLLTQSIPVGGAGMLRILAQQLDIMILTWLTTIQTVGLFSGPYRISMALRFIPQTMSMPLYPMYSRLASDPEQKRELEEAYERSIKFFLLVALPITILFLVGSERLIITVLGARYAPAVPAMQWLAVAFIPFFISSPLPFLLTALHEQRYLLASTAISVALRAAFNFSLIPVLGFLGPCIAFLVSETLTVVLWMSKLSRLGFSVPIFTLVGRLLIAAVLMATPLYFVRQQALLWFIPTALLTLVIYAVAVLKLRVLSPRDLQLAREGAGFLRPFLAGRKQRASRSAA